MTDRVGLARVYCAWPTPPHFTADDAALDLLGHVLGGGKTSRLFRALVREKQIAQDAQAYQDGQELTSEFAIVATVRPGHTIAEVEAAVAEEIAHIKAEPPADDELERAVNTYEARTIRSLESVGGFGGRADQLNLYNTYTGDPGYVVKDFARYTQIDAATVQKMAQKYLGPGRVVVEVTPGSEVTIEPNPAVAAEAAREEMAKKLRTPAGLLAAGRRGGQRPRVAAGSRCRAEIRAATDASGRSWPTECKSCWWRSTSCRSSICTSSFPLAAPMTARIHPAWPI